MKSKTRHPEPVEVSKGGCKPGGVDWDVTQIKTHPEDELIHKLQKTITEFAHSSEAPVYTEDHWNKLIVDYKGRRITVKISSTPL